MRFVSVTAVAFGALADRTLRLREGLNVIVGPNDSGKSTWHAAMYAALCGLPPERLRTRVGAVLPAPAPTPPPARLVCRGRDRVRRAPPARAAPGPAGSRDRDRHVPRWTVGPAGVRRWPRCDPAARPEPPFVRRHRLGPAGPGPADRRAELGRGAATGRLHLRRGQGRRGRVRAAARLPALPDRRRERRLPSAGVRGQPGDPGAAGAGPAARPRSRTGSRPNRRRRGPGPTWPRPRSGCASPGRRSPASGRPTSRRPCSGSRPTSGSDSPNWTNCRA